MTNRVLREQGVGGSNPLAPTSYKKNDSKRVALLFCPPVRLWGNNEPNKDKIKKGSEIIAPFKYISLKNQKIKSWFEFLSKYCQEQHHLNYTFDIADCMTLCL